MRRPVDDETRVPAPRYHMPGPDDLFRPIIFGFVTDAMCREILAERRLILSLTPQSLHARQRRLFAKYDPKQSAEAFHSMLRLFAADADE